MTTQWFGPTWNAPVNDPENLIETPVTMPCIDCEGPITIGDQGLVIPSSDPSGKVAFHKECFFRAIGVPGE